MTLRLVRSGSLFVIFFASAVAIAVAAQSSRQAIRPAGGAAKGDPRRAAKGPLPDPVLLDGAKHPPEKRSEHGMIGEFELPGNEDARDDRVGGQQGQPAGGEQEQPEQQGAPGGGGQQVAQQQEEQGGGGGQQPQQGGPQGAGQTAGQGGPNAQPQGIQVASLQGEGGGNAGDMSNTRKPSQVSIGDSAMQIKTQPNNPSVVGAQQPAGKTQQHEKTTGTGGRPPTGNNSNRGAEKGRTMPAGL